mgnify:CR=1 FL=1
MMRRNLAFVCAEYNFYCTSIGQDLNSGQSNELSVVIFWAFYVPILTQTTNHFPNIPSCPDQIASLYSEPSQLVRKKLALSLSSLSLAYADTFK